MAESNRKKTYELKKIGKHFLIGTADTKFKRLTVLTNAKQVELSDNFLVVDDDTIYEIKEDEAGEVILVKIDDVPVHENQPTKEDFVENVNTQKEVTFKNKDGDGLFAVSHESDNLSVKSDADDKTEHENSKPSSSFESFEDELSSFSEENKQSKPNEGKNSFPLPIYYENQNSDEKENKVPVGGASTCSDSLTTLASVANDDGEKDDNKSDQSTSEDCNKSVHDVEGFNVAENNACELENKYDLREDHNLTPPCPSKAGTQKSDIENDKNADVDKLDSLCSKPDQSLSVEGISEEIADDEKSTADELEMGQTEENYESLEAGQTEETSLIETVVLKDGKGSSQGCMSDEVKNERKDEIKVLEIAWKVISIRHSKKLERLKPKCLDLRYDSGTLFVSMTGSVGVAERNFKELRQFIELFNNKEYDEVSVDYVKNVSTLCDETENEIGYECCFYLHNEQKVIIYGISYEDCLRVKHFLLKKSDFLKLTRRSRSKMHKETEHEVLPQEETFQTEVESQELVSVEPGAEACSAGTDLHLLPSSDDKASLKEDECVKNIGHLSDANQKMTGENYIGNMKVFRTIEGVKMCIYKADILNVQVDCIVGASNEILTFGGGISAVIAKAAGEELAREAKNYVKYNGRLPVGGVFSTTAGKLQYKYVIFAVGPIWYNYEPHTTQSEGRCLKDLHSTVYNSLLEAEKRGMRTIALPAISSGIFGVPQDLCAQAYCKAAVDYSRASSGKQSGLSEIHFIDKNVIMHDKICESFETLCQTSQKYVLDIARFPDLNGKAASSKSSQKFASSMTGDGISSKKQIGFDWNHDARSVQRFCTPENIQVFVYEAGILKLPVDCIVNASNDTLKHGGGIAYVIANGAGRQLVQEGNSFIRKNGSIRTGGTCVTTAGNLPYACVVHAVGPRWWDYNPHTDNDVRRCEDDLYNAVYNSSKQAEIRKLRSIAIPAISAAIFGVPEDLCVHQYVRAAIDYTRNSSGRQHRLMQIHFIDKNPAIVKKIQEAFHLVLVEGKQNPYKRGLFVKCRQSKLQTEVKKNFEKPHTGTVKTCSICLEGIANAKQLPCGHRFCSDCIETQFRFRRVCPDCGMIYGILTGNQPDGTMNVEFAGDLKLAGYGKYGSIILQYTFPNGRQRKDNPSPGKRYRGAIQTAYLPQNKEGKRILKMLRVAFDRKLLFTLGLTAELDDEVTLVWNGITQKTDLRPNHKSGYPDPTYFNRVKQELAAVGVFERDV